MFYQNNIKTTNTQDLIHPKLSSNSLCQQVLWEFGLTTNCNGALGPVGVASSGATGLDKIWRLESPSLSWSMEDSLTWWLGDLLGPSHYPWEWRTSSWKISSLAASFCIVGVLYILPLFNKPDLNTEIPPSLDTGSLDLLPPLSSRISGLHHYAQFRYQGFINDRQVPVSWAAP